MDASDLNKHTLLIVAVQYDYLTIVELLLEYGAHIEAVGSYNDFSTALNLAAEDC